MVLQDEIIVVHDAVVDENKIFKIEEVFKFCEIFDDFDEVLKNLTKKIQRFFEEIRNFKIEIQKEPTNVKILLKKTKNPIDFAANFAEILSFLSVKLFVLMKNKSFFVKKLRLFRILSLCPYSPELQKTAESLYKDDYISFFELESVKNSANQKLNESQILQRIRNLITTDDLRIIKTNEETELQNLSSSLTNYSTKERYFILKNLSVPESTRRIIEIVYEIFESICRNTETSIRKKKLNLIRNIIQLFVSCKGNSLINNSLPNTICFFYNSCKYIIYHIIVINTRLNNTIPEAFADGISFSDVIFQLKSSSTECFLKIYKQICFNVSENLNVLVVNNDNLVENITQALNTAGNSFVLIKEILDNEVSCKFIGKLLDFLIFQLENIAERCKIDIENFKSAVNKIFEFEVFFNGCPQNHSHEWLRFKKIYKIL